MVSRLKVSQPKGNVHTELVSALGWNVSNELYSCSDDQSIHKWNMEGRPDGKVPESRWRTKDNSWFC